MQEQHPFAKYVAILARGKTKQRHLTVDEAIQSMKMILDGDALPEQIGAFLMLLRLKEEAPEEIAGFTLGSRATFDLPDGIPGVDIDWSSYAGKRIQLPWFILAALALAGAGYRVFMHGTDGHTAGRVYTEETLRQLGIVPANSLSEAADHIGMFNFAYVSLDVLSPKLRELIEFKADPRASITGSQLLTHAQPFQCANNDAGDISSWVHGYPRRRSRHSWPTAYGRLSRGGWRN